MEWGLKMDKKRFGKQLQKARKERHITGEQLAELTNLSTTYIRQLENGLRLPSLPVFVNIINALNCSADMLLADSVENAEDIILDEISEKLRGLSPERRIEVSIVFEAMLGYMK